MAAAGCGGRSTGTVSGKVYHKNAPVKGGNVTFLTSDKRVSKVAEIKEDGSYEIAMMPAGEAVIAVDTSTMKPPQMRVPMKNESPKGQKAPPGYKMSNFAEKAKRYVPIPPQYANPEKSGLTYVVKRGKQENDIQLPREDVVQNEFCFAGFAEASGGKTLRRSQRNGLDSAPGTYIRGRP